MRCIGHQLVAFLPSREAIKADVAWLLVISGIQGALPMHLEYPQRGAVVVINNE